MKRRLCICSRKSRQKHSAVGTALALALRLDPKCGCLAGCCCGVPLPRNMPGSAGESLLNRAQGEHAALGDWQYHCFFRRRIQARSCLSYSIPPAALDHNFLPCKSLPIGNQAFSIGRRDEHNRRRVVLTRTCSELVLDTLGGMPILVIRRRNTRRRRWQKSRVASESRATPFCQGEE